MDLAVLYVANLEDFLKYTRKLRRMGIKIPVRIISQEDRSSFVLKLPSLVTKYNTYEGEFEIEATLQSCKKGSK